MKVEVQACLRLPYASLCWVALKPTSGEMPMAHSGMASKDRSVTTRNFAAQAKPRPKPMVMPSIKAITGTPSCLRVWAVFTWFSLSKRASAWLSDEVSRRVV